MGESCWQLEGTVSATRSSDDRTAVIDLDAPAQGLSLQMLPAAVKRRLRGTFWECDSTMRIGNAMRLIDAARLDAYVRARATLVATYEEIMPCRSAGTDLLATADSRRILACSLPSMWPRHGI